MKFTMNLLPSNTISKMSVFNNLKMFNSKQPDFQKKVKDKVETQLWAQFQCKYNWNWILSRLVTSTHPANGFKPFFPSKRIQKPRNCFFFLKLAKEKFLFCSQLTKCELLLQKTKQVNPQFISCEAVMNEPGKDIWMTSNGSSSSGRGRRRGPRQPSGQRQS